MRYLNVLDEQGRFIYFKVLPNEPDGQQDSHTMSYVAVRKCYREIHKFSTKIGIEQMPEQSGLEEKVNGNI